MEQNPHLLAQQLIEARQFEQAAALLAQPQHDVVHEAARCRLVGVLLLHRDQPREAEAWLRSSLELAQPPETYDNLSVALIAQGRYAEAEPLCRQALALAPQFAIAANNLATCLRNQSKFQEAVDVNVRAVNLNPQFVGAWGNLISLLREVGMYPQSIDVGNQALARFPDEFDISRHLGDCLLWIGKITDSANVFRNYMTRHPEHAQNLRKLGQILFQCLGELEEGMRYLRRAIELDPADVTTHSAYLCCLQYQDGLSPADLLREHKLWDDRHTPTGEAPPRWLVDRQLPRPLKIAVLTSDLGEHPVARLTVAAFEGLAQLPCTLVAYNDRNQQDPLSQRLRRTFHEWRDVAPLSSPQVAEMIRQDRIDVLFDLAGHTRGMRLSVFAERPAPVQITWLGYQGTTGLRAMDYLLADPRLTPPGAENNYRERILNMPHHYVVWDATDEMAPPVGPLPALASGRFTFGSFNHPAKIAPAMFDLWCEILRQTPGSRLILKYRWFQDEPYRRDFAARFVRQGIAAERIDLQPGWDRKGMVESYGQLDLALDPLPFTGGMTTAEALWMGVPVLTWPGETFASRQSLSYVEPLGLHEFIASSKEDYLAKAIGWTKRLPELAEIRSGMRTRMLGSPLTDGARFARDLLERLQTALAEKFAQETLLK